jgi:hypothetical protein
MAALAVDTGTHDRASAGSDSSAQIAQLWVQDGQRRLGPVAEQNGGSVSVLPDFHLSLSVMPLIDVARGRVREVRCERSLGALARSLAEVLVDLGIRPPRGPVWSDLDEWWGHQVDADFRFFELPAIAGAMEGAGFRTEMRLERLSYPGEVETRRGYLLARRQP